MAINTVSMIRMVKIGDLIPYVNNARTHSESQILGIASSIKEYGFNNPVLCDGGNGVVAGHGRIMAARKLGMEEVPVIELSHLSEVQKRGFILADNRWAENGAGWDNDILALEIEALQFDDVDFDAIGFDGDEISELLSQAENNPEDAETNQLEQVEYQVIVECEDEVGQSFLIGDLESKGFKCRPLIL